MTSREREITVLLAAVLLLNVAIYGLAAFTGSGLPLWVRPFFWLALSVYLWARPRVRPQAHLRFYPFAILLATLLGAVLMISYHAAGFLTATGSSPYSRTVMGIAGNLLLVASVPIAMEWVRNYTINGVERARTPWFATAVVVLFTASQCNLNRLAGINSLEAFAAVVGGQMLPQLLANLLLTYLVYVAGAAPAMLYAAIVTVPTFLMPILPDLDWLLNGIIGCVVPIVGVLVLQDAYRKSAGLAKPNRKKDSPYGWLPLLVASVLVVWFAVGLFPVYPVTIMSGSMEPLVYPGDVVLIQRTQADQLKTGDIVEYWASDVFVIHRLIDTNVLNGRTVYITKGDNNNVRDAEPVAAEQIRGKVIATVPKMGMLTFLLRSR